MLNSTTQKSHEFSELFCHGSKQDYDRTSDINPANDQESSTAAASQDRTTTYGQDWFGAVDVLATNTGWVHVSVPLNANPNVTAIIITNSTAVGTWTLKFNNASSGTLTAPGGTLQPFTIADANVATEFADPAVAYFGIQPNSTAGHGQYIDYASMSVSGASVTQEFEDYTKETTFNASGQWANNSAQASTNTPYWINCSLPAVGYNPGTVETVTGNINTSDGYMSPEYYNGYADGPNLPGGAIQGSKNWVSIPATCLPMVDGTATGAKSKQAYFRLFNPPLIN